MDTRHGENIMLTTNMCQNAQSSKTPVLSLYIKIWLHIGDITPAGYLNVFCLQFGAISLFGVLVKNRWDSLVSVRI